MELITLLLVNTAVLAFFLIVLFVVWAVMPSRSRLPDEFISDENELDQIKHQVELEGEQEAEEELMPYKPPRLDSPRNRKRL
ncbi:MAG: hypothetical protein AABX53_04570 [Nanoarchaeota archaeon]